jgi:hypothetical protein
MRAMATLAFLGALLVAPLRAQKYEYKVVTIVESVIPMGLGRSRMIETTSALDYKEFTGSRGGGKETKATEPRGESVSFNETALLNLYSGTGINFGNIAVNDALITSKINEMISQGWELAFVVSAVESNAGQGDGSGIFITRLFFRRPK